MSFVTTAIDNSSRSARHSAATVAVFPDPTGPPSPTRSARRPPSGYVYRSGNPPRGPCAYLAPLHPANRCSELPQPDRGCTAPRPRGRTGEAPHRQSRTGPGPYLRCRSPHREPHEANNRTAQVAWVWAARSRRGRRGRAGNGAVRAGAGRRGLGGGGDRVDVGGEAGEDGRRVEGVEREEPYGGGRGRAHAVVGGGVRGVERQQARRRGGDAEDDGLVGAPRPAAARRPGRRGPHRPGGAQELAAEPARHRTQRGRRRPRVGRLVEAERVDAGGRRRGQCGGDQSCGVQPPAAEVRERLRVPYPPVGHRGLHPAGVRVPAGREAPVGEQQQRGPVGGRSGVRHHDPSEQEVPLGHGKFRGGRGLDHLAVDPHRKVSASTSTRGSASFTRMSALRTSRVPRMAVNSLPRPSRSGRPSARACSVTKLTELAARRGARPRRTSAVAAPVAGWGWTRWRRPSARRRSGRP